MEVEIYTRHDLGGVEAIIITLDNGNKLHIQETDSGIIEVKNITTIHPDDKGIEYGLMVSPINYSTIEIVPEG